MADQNLEFTATLIDAISAPLTAIADALTAVATTMQATTDTLVTGFGAASGSMTAFTTATDLGAEAVVNFGAAAQTQAATLATNTTAIIDNTVATQLNSDAEVTAGAAATTTAGQIAALGGVADATSGSVDALAGQADILAGSIDALDANTAAAATTMADAAVNAGALADAENIATDAVTANTDAVTANTDATTANTAATGASAAAGAAGAPARKTGYGAILGATMLLGMAGAAVKTGESLIQAGMDGETALNKVIALADTSGKYILYYQQQIENMAPVVGSSVQDLANGLYDIASVGYKGADAMNILKYAAEAAAAGGTDLHTVTNGLTSIMKAFGMSANDASVATDVLITGVTEGKAPFADFSRAIGLVGVNAKLAGFNIQDSTAALATLTTVWPSVRQAGQNLQNTIQTLALNYDALTAHANKLGLTFNQQAYEAIPTLQEKLEYLWTAAGKNNDVFRQLVGNATTAKVGLYLLGDGAAQFQQNLNSMSGAMGATDAAFATHNESMQAHINQMQGGLSALALKISSFAEPAINGAFGILAGAFSRLADAFTAHANLMGPILVALAFIIGGTLVGAIAALLSVLAPLMAAAMEVATPFIIVGAIIGVVIGYFISMYQTSKPLRDALSALGMALGGLFKAIGTLFTPLAQLKGNLDIVSVPANALASGIKNIAQAISPTSALMQQLFGSTTQVKGVHEQWDDVIVRVNGHLVHTREAVDATTISTRQVPGSLQGAKDAFSGLGTALQGVLGFFQSTPPKTQAVLVPFSQVETITRTVNGHLMVLHTTVQGMHSVMQTTGGSASGFQQVLTALGHASQFLGTLLKPIADELGGQIGNVFHQLGMTIGSELLPAWQGLQKSFVSIEPAIKVVAAIIGGSLLISLGLIVGVIVGVIRALGAVISGFIQFGAGVFRIFSGIVQVLTSIWGTFFAVLGDIIHGNFGKIAQDVGKGVQGVVSGIQNILGGLWGAIQGVYLATLGAIIGLISGFVGTVIGWFQHLFDKLVGHSIVTDLAKSIINIFTQFPLQVLAGIARFINVAIAFFMVLRDRIIAVVLDTVQKFINAILELEARVLEAINIFINAAITFFEAWRDRIIAVVLDTVQKFINAILELEVRVLEAINTFINTAIAFFDMWRDRIIQTVLDTINMILDLLGSLVSKGQTAIQNVVNGIINILKGLPGHAGTWITSMINTMISTIQNSVGRLADAVGNLVKHGISDLFPHSPAKVGPLREIPNWMPKMTDMLVDGLNTNTPRVGSAAGNLAAAIKNGVLNGVSPTTGLLRTAAGATLGAGGGTFLGSGGAGNNSNQQLTVNLNGGLGDGLRMLNASDRATLVQQLAQEMAAQFRMQINSQNTAYSGY